MVPNSNREWIVLAKMRRCFRSLETKLAHRVMRPSMSGKPIRGENSVLKSEPFEEFAFGLSMRGPDLGGVKHGVRSMELGRIGRS